ncbi:MAG TPA: sialidase family protein [Actinomycetota bacterium]|nr:sialidase family protein [Actinomycetota bacterium]
MTRLAVLLSSLLLAFGLQPAVAADESRIAAAAPGPRVLRDVQAAVHELKTTGQQQADTATEPSISVNPENPLNAVALYQAGRVDSGCAQVNGYATTFDGGKTWTYGPLPKLTQAVGGTSPLASDPVVAFGPDNVVYANSLMCDEGGNNLAFNVSTNGGKTWSDPMYVPNERTFPNDDKNWIVVDNSDAPGHHKGRIYLVWDQIAPVVAMYSDDQAQTWHGPFLIYAGPGIGTIPLITPAGDLAVVFNTLASPVPPLYEDPSAYDPATLTAPSKMLISVAPRAGSIPTGGPLIFAPPTTVDAWRGTDIRTHRASDFLPFAAIDPNSGRIYATWTDNRFRDDVVNDIVITHSDDLGITWSGLRRVNPGKPDDLVEHFTPTMAVGEDGIVRISYRTQKQADVEPKFSPYVDTVYQQSADGGETWTKPTKVNVNVRTDVRFAAFGSNEIFLGDYSQVAVIGSWAYVVRAEAFRLSANEPARFPPRVRHQRVWVAVVDADGNGKI